VNKTSLPLTNDINQAQQLHLWSPPTNCALDSSFNSLSSAAETKRDDHLVDDLVVRPQLAVGSNPF
jgi:hypothetical protein